jgi:hypothetical protein
MLNIYSNLPWRRGTVDLAAAPETEHPGSNAARVLGFLEKQDLNALFVS